MQHDGTPRRIGRRTLLAGVAGLGVAGAGLAQVGRGLVPFTSTAPGAKRPARIGVLWSVGAYVPTFTEKELGTELARLGHNEGRDYLWEIRNAEGQANRIPELAAELVRLPCDIITATSNTTIWALQRVTRTIPLVVAPFDALGTGLVANLARPGGNLTGYTYGGRPSTRAKLKLLKDVVPGLRRVAVLANTASPNSGSVTQDADVLASEMDLSISVFATPSAASVASVLESTRAWSAEALVPVTATAISDPVQYGGAGEQLVEFALKHRLPLVVSDGAGLLSGPLLTYSDSTPTERAKVMARQIDRILRGARPGDLPIQQSTVVTLTVNLRTSRMIGLTIPPVVLARATRIIQ
jgi:putative ABC transport system substrate-binding protein